MFVPLFLFLTMIIRWILLASGMFFFCFTGNCQTILKGKIYQAENDSIISAVNILNLTAKQSTRSTGEGNYIINATEGDQIVFSRTGFNPDTVTINYRMLLTQFDITLHKRIILLQPVKVSSNYRADSSARRNYYNSIYEKQPGITGRNRPADGVGIVAKT